MKKILFVIFCFALVSETALAQKLAIGPQFGIFKTVETKNPATIPGGAIRLYLGEIAIEGSLLYKKDEYTYTTTTGSASIFTESFPINLTAMFKLFSAVHAEAGIGWYNTKIDYSKLKNAWVSLKEETKGQFAYHLGGGAELPLGNLTLTGDIRYVFSKLEMSKLLKPETVKSDFYVIMFGVMLNL